MILLFSSLRGKFGEPRESHDARCAACGSLLASMVRETAWLHVTYGNLHDAPDLEVKAAIKAGSKEPWPAITDDLRKQNEV